MICALLGCYAASSGSHTETRSSRLLSRRKPELTQHSEALRSPCRGRGKGGSGGEDEVKARNKVYLNVIQLKVLAVTLYLQQSRALRKWLRVLRCNYKKVMEMRRQEKKRRRASVNFCEIYSTRGNVKMCSGKRILSRTTTTILGFPRRFNTGVEACCNPAILPCVPPCSTPQRAFSPCNTHACFKTYNTLIRTQRVLCELRIEPLYAVWININLQMVIYSTVRCVIPVVCVTNEREESVVKQHN